MQVKGGLLQKSISILNFMENRDRTPEKVVNEFENSIDI